MHIGAITHCPEQISIPFPVMVGPGEVVWHPGWVQAFVAVRAGLDSDSIVVLSGQPGVGKSLLLLALREIFEEEGRSVVLLPGNDFKNNQQPDFILLDDAEQVPPLLLQHLVSGTPRCVLVGPAALLDDVGAFVTAPVLVQMRPLLHEEVEPYLLTQIERAGLPNSLLGPGTSEACAQEAQGNPRHLQKLASRALFRAWIDNADQVSTAHVSEALSLQEQAEPLVSKEPSPGSAPMPRKPDQVAAAGVHLRVSEEASEGSSCFRLQPWVIGTGTVIIGLAMVALFTAQQHGQATVPSSSVHAAADLSPPADHQPIEPGPVIAATAPDAHPMPVETSAEPVVPVTQPVPVLSDPPPPPLAPPLARPAAVPVHVAVGFSSSDATAGSRAVALVGTLKDAGLDAVLAVGPVSEQSTAIRYFYAKDQAVAAQLARQVGEASHEHLVPVRGTPPRPGTIQVVIASDRLAGR